MIYVHRFEMAFGHKKKPHVRVYEDEDKALEQQRLIGGTLQAYDSVENIENEWALREHIKELVIDEVACLIDDVTTDAPGSPRNYEPGSAQWDSWKLKTLNNIRNIMDAKFN